MCTTKKQVIETLFFGKGCILASLWKVLYCCGGHSLEIQQQVEQVLIFPIPLLPPSPWNAAQHPWCISLSSQIFGCGICMDAVLSTSGETACTHTGATLDMSHVSSASQNDLCCTLHK